MTCAHMTVNQTRLLESSTNSNICAMEFPHSFFSSRKMQLQAIQPTGSSPSLTTEAVEEDDAVPDDISAASFPLSASIFFLHA